MKLRVNDDEMAKWQESAGSVTDAALLIVKALGCSFSKGEKLASGRYPYGLTLSEQRELCRLTKRSKDVLFPEPCRAQAG